ncbi:MAG: hypothetical protein ACRDF9_13785 [Candidatus Limnocylindria bacterium]
MTTVYLAGVGFRTAGVRLVAPVSAALGGRTLTLRELVATPEGTELTYHVAGLTGDEGYTPRQDVIAIRSGSVEHALARGAFSLHSDPTGLRRQISSTSPIPQWTGPVEIAIAIEDVGEFRLAAELRPFGRQTDAPRQDVNTSVTHDGITVMVRGIGAAREETAVEIEVAVGDGECCVGIGGYQGHRLGPTALSIRDESGRVYAERWQEPGRLDHVTLALFEPLHRDAHEVELAVPYVFVEESATTDALALPVTSPVEARLGRYPIRVLATTRVEADSGAGNVAYHEPALGVDLDLGGWHGDRRVLLPGRILVGRDFRRVGYRLPGTMNYTRPEPVDRLELTGDPLTAKTLGFTHPTIQIRGPWRLRFSLVPKQ